MDILDMILDGGIPAYVIVVMGVCALALIIERAKVLFLDYAINAQEFMAKIKSFILADKIEDAITYCASNSKVPLAHVIKGVLERSDRDDDGIYQGLDISLSEVIPSLGKRLGYLAMISNVATLVGLLGTISGLIMSFEAVSKDVPPDQKQEFLSQGIAMAMNTTVLGLSVAIPVMMAYAFLHARQGKLLEEISETSTKVVDLLTTRHYQAFDEAKVFPGDLATEQVANKKGKSGPPPADKKTG